MADEKRLIEYVNREEVCNLCDNKKEYCGKEKCPVYKAPVTNAVEVVHGRWECIYDEATGETDVTCSHCKNTRTVNGCYVTTKSESCYFEDNYCPNCGAKMDGDGNG